MTKIHIDFETYCDLDLRKVGLDVYVRHPSFEVLMMAWALEHDQVQWVEDPVVIHRILETEAKNAMNTWYAFNAPFERMVLKHVLGINVPIERWRCVMVHAYSLGFHGGLGDVGKQMGLPEDKQKTGRGRQLIHKFCKPAPRNHLVDRYTKDNAPEAWEEFKQYNIQDVVAEREIELLLSKYPMSDEEWDLWFIDQRINDRGLPVDRELTDRAIEVYHAEKRHLLHQLRKLTGLENPNSVQQFQAWVTVRGLNLPNLQADTITLFLENKAGDMTPEVYDALKLRQQAARSAGAKWETFERQTDWDTRRIRHQFQFAGAQRTKRWSGRGLQPHNLHRSPEDQDEKIRTMLV